MFQIDCRGNEELQRHKETKNAKQNNQYGTVSEGLSHTEKSTTYLTGENNSNSL